MEITLAKPHLLSWLAIPLLLLIGFVFRHQTRNIQLSDTYCVIANLRVVIVASALLVAIGLGYLLIHLKGGIPNLALTAFHLIMTVSVFVLLIVPYFKTTSLLSPVWVFSA